MISSPCWVGVVTIRGPQIVLAALHTAVCGLVGSVTPLWSATWWLACLY